ncbi:MAG TPA: hypothetical protein PK904_01600 [Bacteroidales bacterium]|nr:hypothetical protein [Bacteroidales bacterium]
MNKILRNTLIVFLIFAGFTGCETDFDTTAPYKDITIVYGLLDSKDSMQYIKINKAFLAENNVLTYAALEDSNSYPYPLDVWIEEWSSGDSVKAIYFDTTSVYNKEPGQFYNPRQIIYKWNKPAQPFKIKYVVEGLNDTIGVEYYWLNDESDYRLKIRNPKNGKVISAETPLVQDFSITRPGFATFIRFVPDPATPKQFSWESAENSGQYDYELRFNYRELNFGSNDTIDKHITLASQSVTADPGTNEYSFFYWDYNFYSACRSLIPYTDQNREDQVKDRFTGTIELIVAAAETQFSLYRQVYEPSTSIVQEKPTYTNVDNGLGIFSSRAQKSKAKKLHAETVTDLKNTEDNIYKFVY